MNRIFLGTAAAAALALTGVSAHASCADARTGAQGAFHSMSPGLLQQLTGEGRFGNGSAADDIVGTWLVTYTSEGAPFGEALIQWHPDGTEMENINLPVLSGNLCMGSWKPVDRRHVSRFHIGWLYTNGVLSGHFTETETDEVANDGNSYKGTNTQKIFDLNNNLIVQVTGTSSATRISP
jgi:hypothetical protein